MKLIFGTCTGLNHETQNLVDKFHFELELAFSVDNTMCHQWVEGSSRKGKKALHHTIFLSFCSMMDFLSLMLVWSTACKTGGQHQQFDDLFCGLLYECDLKRVMHYAFDVLAKWKVLSAQVLDIIYVQLYCPPVFHPDADFEDEVTPMAACVLAFQFRSALCAGRVSSGSYTFTRCCMRVSFAACIACPTHLFTRSCSFFPQSSRWKQNSLVVVQVGKI